MKKYIITFIIIIFSTYGCVLTKYNIDHSITLDNITTLVAKNTPNYCNYRGKANVTLKGEQKISFTVLLSKKCNDEVLINVLGALNNPVAAIKYENNKVDVKTQSKENTEEIKRIADNSIFHILYPPFLNCYYQLMTESDVPFLSDFFHIKATPEKV